MSDLSSLFDDAREGAEWLRKMALIQSREDKRIAFERMAAAVETVTKRQENFERNSEAMRRG